jgi:rod shape-determining protein MreD
VRRVWLPPVLIFIGIVIQLTVLDGLRLPQGGVPDLVLVLVAALAVAEGPMAGLIIGFAAGLSLDLAPPGSALIGQYALVFCLTGWAAGRLAGGASRSPLRTVLLMGVVVAAAEAASAALGLVLVPAEVTVAEIRAVLPASIAYDLLLCPFALYLVVQASGRLAAGSATATAGGTASAAPESVRSRRAAGRTRPLQPRLRAAAARTGDGWVGGGYRGHYRARPPARPSVRLHAASGVPGSASGLTRHRGSAASPAVNLRMGTPRRGDGAIGNAVGLGAGLRPHQQPGRHPGQSRFRPRGGELGGSAARLHGGMPARPQGQVPIRFGQHRGDASVGRTLGSGWATPPARPPSGPRLGSGWITARKPMPAGPQLRMGARRSAITGGGSPAAVPRLQFKAAAPPTARRPIAAPRFGRRSSLFGAAARSGLVSGGALDASTFRAIRRRNGTPRLRLASRGRATGMLGGSGGSALRRPVARVHKQPRFGYGKRSPLAFPAVRRIGGQWLARKRAGRRSGAWLIGKRTGGVR